MLKYKNFFIIWRVKFIALFLIFLIALSLILGFILGTNNLLVASGSTTVLPLLQQVGAKYYNENGQKLIVNPGGSTTGIEQIKNNKYIIDYGDASRYPTNSETGTNFSSWTNLSTFTIAYDAIAFAVNLSGTGYTVEGTPSNSLQLTPNDIYNIYTGTYTKWGQLLSPSRVGPNTGLVCSLQDCSNAQITTIMRESGSGTRDAFFAALDNYKNLSSGSTQNSYNNAVQNSILNRPLQGSSNGMVKNYIASVNGTIGFLSSGYILETGIKDNPKVNVVTMNIQQADLSYMPYYPDPDSPTAYTNYQNKVLESINALNPTDSVANQDKYYLFWHAMNVIINTTNPRIEKIAQFLTWLVHSQDTLIQSIGFLPIKIKNSSAQWVSPTVTEIMLAMKDDADKDITPPGAVWWTITYNYFQYLYDHGIYSR